MQKDYFEKKRTPCFGLRGDFTNKKKLHKLRISIIEDLTKCWDVTIKNWDHDHQKWGLNHQKIGIPDLDILWPQLHNHNHNHGWDDLWYLTNKYITYSHIPKKSPRNVARNSIELAMFTWNSLLFPRFTGLIHGPFEQQNLFHGWGARWCPASLGFAQDGPRKHRIIINSSGLTMVNG